MIDTVAQPTRQPGTLKQIITRYPFLPALIILVVLLTRLVRWMEARLHRAYAR